VAGLTLLPVLVLPVVLVDKVLYRIPAPWSWLTALIQAAALVLLVVGVAQTGVMSFLGLRQLLMGGDEPASRLVVHGLYRYVRHPLYTAGLVIIWLMPVMSCNLLALNIGLTLYILIGAFFEERKMLRDFGETYADYQRRTPMLIPGLHLKK
jgi:protein-S-isoprenylcysteine O-methyltransferase Ste14